jgi:hypothetical protein
VTPAAQDLRWWSAKAADRHNVVTQLVNGVKERNAYRRQADLHHLRLYADRQVSGFTGGAYARTNTAFLERRPRLSINIVRSCVDAATSLITKARPRATFLTSAGDFDMQQRAKKRERFVSALWHQNQAYSLGQKAFKDSAIFGTGVIKVCREHGRVRLEKTFPSELLVDDTEAIYGEPRSLFQIRCVDKLVLKALFPSKAKDIESAPPPDVKVYGRGSVADQVEVIEAWHLPSSPTAKDGHHGIYTANAALLDEPYAHEAFPFAFMRWNEDPLGWWGTGIAYELTGIQYEINQLVRAAQAGMYAGANFKVLVERGSKIVKAHLNNDIRGTVVEYTGAPPSFIAPDAVSNQLLAHLQWLVEQGYAITGISQMGARSEIPAELMGSGRAQLVYQNTEAKRFLTVQRQYESFFMDLSERCMEAAADLYESDKSLFVNWVGEKAVERIAFEEVQGDADAFHVQVFPTSALPNDPAGRFAYVEQLRAGQYIDQAEAKKLLDFPDVAHELDLDLAPIELIDERIDRILNTGEYFGPHPRMDLELALKRGSLAYQRAELNGTPPERLDLLGQFVDECVDMLEAAAPPPPAPGMVPNPTAPDMGAPLPGDAPMPMAAPMPGPMPIA